jgi:cytochrome b561
MHEQKYPLPLRVLHWLIAVCIIFMIALGWTMAEVLPRDYPYHAQLYTLHKSLGVTVLLLVALRLIVRLSRSAPPLPDEVPAREKTLAKLSYFLVYPLMLGTPIIGILMTNAFGMHVPFWGIELPKILPQANRALGKLLAGWHAYFAYALLAYIVIHVAAVIKHYAKDKVNLLRRMW